MVAIIVDADLDFGKMLSRAREDADMSVGDLARAAGTSRSAIYAYETGERDPSLTTANRLLACCGYTLDIVLVDT